MGGDANRAVEAESSGPAPAEHVVGLGPGQQPPTHVQAEDATLDEGGEAACGVGAEPAGRVKGQAVFRLSSGSLVNSPSVTARWKWGWGLRAEPKRCRKETAPSRASAGSGPSRPGRSTLEQHPNAFIESHPEGWGHDQWLGLLAELEEMGFDVSDPTAIGHEMESQRLAWELRRRGVPGLGPKRIDAVVEHFGTLWSLRDVDRASNLYLLR